MSNFDSLNKIISFFNENDIDIKSKIANFVVFLEIIKKNNAFREQILLAVKNKTINIYSGVIESEIFLEILTNKEIQKFIFEYDYIEDIININTVDELNKIYTECKDYIKMSENTNRLLDNKNIYVNYCLSSNDKFIDLSNNYSCDRSMSRSNYTGLQTVDFHFNPF